MVDIIFEDIYGNYYHLEEQRNMTDHQRIITKKQFENRVMPLRKKRNSIEKADIKL